VFFLGLLSTPLPYLLIAAFYFFGFAMGVFNSNTEEESVEVLVTASIPAEIDDNQSNGSTFYYQDYTPLQQLNDQFIVAEDAPIPDFPDTGPPCCPCRRRWRGGCPRAA